MARIFTTDNSRSVEATLTDAAAAAACRRVPATHRDHNFGRDLANAYSRYGANLTHNRRVWLHIIANQQVTRETAVAAPVASAAAVSAPVSTPAAAPVSVVSVTTAPIGEEELTKAADGLALTMLMYDIPSASNIDNPSGFLHTRGLRLNKSVWIVPTGSVPHNLINELRKVGSTVVTAPYDVAAARGLLEAAMSFANAELAAAAKRAEVSALAAAAKLNDAGTPGDPNSKRRVYDREMAAIAKRLNDLADRMAIGANIFGVRNGIAFGELRHAAATLSATTAARATVYANAATVLEECGTVESVAMAAAVKLDEAPAFAVAGMLEDHGKADEANAVAAAFSEGADEGAAVTSFENEVFSIADMGEDD